MIFKCQKNTTSDLSIIIINYYLDSLIHSKYQYKWSCSNQSGMGSKLFVFKIRPSP